MNQRARQSLCLCHRFMSALAGDPCTRIAVGASETRATGSRESAQIARRGQTRASQPPFQKPKSALVLRKFVPTCTRKGETANTANRYSFFREPFIRLHMKLKSSVERRGGVRCSPPFVMHGSRSLGMPFFGLRSLVRSVILLRSANMFHALCGFGF